MPTEFWPLAIVFGAVAILVARLLFKGSNAHNAFALKVVAIFEPLVSANADFMQIVQPGLEFSFTDPFAVPRAYRQCQDAVQAARTAVAGLDPPRTPDANRLVETLRAYLAVCEGTLLSNYGEMVQTLKNSSDGDPTATLQLSILILAGAEEEKTAREALEQALAACGVR